MCSLPRGKFLDENNRKTQNKYSGACNYTFCERRPSLGIYCRQCLGSSVLRSCHVCLWLLIVSMDRVPHLLVIPLHLEDLPAARLYGSMC